MPRRLRRIAAASAALGGVILLAPALLAVVNPARDREAPDAVEERAAAALADARTARAASVAPLNMRQAEEAYGEGLVERRRQELRPGPLRDYARTRLLLEEAAAHAERARAVVETVARRSRVRSTQALRLAQGALAPLAGLEERLWLDSDVRTRLQRARALTAEGASLASAGSHVAAEERAHAARAAALEVSRAVWVETARYTEDRELRTWRAWSAETVAWSDRTGGTAIVIDKDEHRLTLYQDGRAVLRYDVELGWNNAGVKRHQGDGATPEGRYRIVQKKGRGSSRYHRALLLDYPNQDDLRALEEMKRAGTVRQGVRAGGLIEIHGNGGRGKDWTDGCVAVTDREIEALFARVAVGTPVTIIGSGTGEGVFADIARRVER